MVSHRSARPEAVGPSRRGGFLLATLVLISAPTASAQYMYLDADGDGVNTTADRLNADRVTHLTVYLDIAHDKDGSEVTCNSHTGEPGYPPNILDIFSYTVTLEVADPSTGTVTWSAWADSIGFPEPFSEERTPFAFVVTRFAHVGVFTPPGFYKLGTIDVTVAAGAPSIRVSTGVSTFLDPFTGFGTRCAGSWNANTYTLGIDWFDTDGVGPPETSVEPYGSRIFTTGANQTFRMQSGKPTYCVEIEPEDGSYDNGSVHLSTISLISEGTGTVDRIFAVGEKTAIAADRDRNGIEEIQACFGRADLERLFAGVVGRRTIPVTVEGVLISGRIFRGQIDLDVIGGSNGPQASVSPNPLNPEATLRITTTAAGPLRARVYDASGRLVRELMDEPFAPAGEHEVRIGKGRAGAELVSGVYFYRVESADGMLTGRFTVLR